MQLLAPTISAIAFLTSVGFAYADTAVIENYVESTANTGGNYSKGEHVVTGEATASASVITEANGNSGTTSVDITVTSNGETETVTKNSAGDVFVEANNAGAIYDNEKKVEIKNVKNSRVSSFANASEDRASEVLESILSALKKVLSYVISFVG